MFLHIMANFKQVLFETLTASTNKYFPQRFINLVHLLITKQKNSALYFLQILIELPPK